MLVFVLVLCALGLAIACFFWREEGDDDALVELEVDNEREGEAADGDLVG